ncbi:MAG: glutamate mutase L [Anaerolineaceae bacterium]|nr:glutamate mutase L [Anaerolineaceae bacterium]
MTISLVNSESLLAIDIGAVHTRASLFDVVEKGYHFIATGTSPSTVAAPYRDAGEGIHLAILNLQEKCGRRLLDDDSRLILPSAPDGSGVDRMVFTYSAGPALRVVVVGLLADVSLESAARLAATIPGQVVETIGLNDNRSPEMQINAILKAQPDLIILSGGTEDGASRSVYQLVELITLVCQVLPQTLRPDVLYAGNRSLAKRIKEILERWTRVKVSPNVRPDVAFENLEPAQRVLAQILTQIRADQIGGISDLARVSSVSPIPTSHAFGRMMKFLSHIYDPQRGVMGIDLGAGSTTIAAAVSGKLALNVLPMGMGSAISEILNEIKIEDIVQWLPIEVNVGVVRDYIWQKQLYPDRVPATSETLAIEQSLVRYVLQLAVKQTILNWPELVMNFEPYIITGSALTLAPSPNSSMLMLLDGIQPMGITTFVLDQNGLMASLGVAA